MSESGASRFPLPWLDAQADLLSVMGLKPYSFALILQRAGIASLLGELADQQTG
jgi:hypothetical protein